MLLITCSQEAWSPVWPRDDSGGLNLFQDTPVSSASPLSCEDSGSPWRLFIPVIIPDFPQGQAVAQLWGLTSVFDAC